MAAHFIVQSCAVSERSTCSTNLVRVRCRGGIRVRVGGWLPTRPAARPSRLANLAGQSRLSGAQGVHNRSFYIVLSGQMQFCVPANKVWPAALGSSGHARWPSPPLSLSSPHRWPSPYARHQPLHHLPRSPSPPPPSPPASPPPSPPLSQPPSSLSPPSLPPSQPPSPPRSPRSPQRQESMARRAWRDAAGPSSVASLLGLAAGQQGSTGQQGYSPWQTFARHARR